jgi:hypothetical protein
MNINRLKLVTLGMLSPVPVLVLLVLACLPVATHADTLTLDGASIDSFSVNTNVKTLSVVMATTDAQQYLTDFTMGTKIDPLSLDEFAVVDGTLTLENELEFLEDVVTSDAMPEPSSVALLASGLLGLIGFRGKKHAAARGGGRLSCCHL